MGTTEAAAAAAAKVVEYLVPMMSKDLLCKFPDNSAFGFDYSQSSIWSPLIPRAPHAPADFDSEYITPKKLFSPRKVSSSTMKMKMSASAAFNKRRPNKNKKKKKKKKKKEEEVSVVRTTSCKCACLPPFATKVLRAATKHFKKKTRRDPLGHVKLSNYLEANPTISRN